MIAAVVWLVWLVCPVRAMAQAGGDAQSTASAAAPRAESHRLARWLDVDAIVVSTRYRYVEDAQDRTRQNQLQLQEQVRARLLLDAGGRYSVNTGIATGGSFGSGWNSTGLGTGEGTARIAIKQLYLAAEPIEGVELQYGSLYFARGDVTEIISFDNDGYVTAGRGSVRRPKDLFFDEVTVSVGYLGYLDEPFVFDRMGAFSRANYWQVLIVKRVGKTLSITTDYTGLDDDGDLRQAARWRIDRQLVDVLHGEYGVRLRGGSHDTALALAGEKRVGRVVLRAGYSDVDPDLAVLSGDRYGPGNHVFAIASVPLPLDLSASWFVQKEISPPSESENDVRVDVVLTWDVLKTLKRAGAVP